MTRQELQRALDAIPDDCSIQSFKIAYDHDEIATECGLMAEKSESGSPVFFCIVSEKNRRIHFGATGIESLHLAVEKAYLGIVSILDGTVGQDSC